VGGDVFWKSAELRWGGAGKVLDFPWEVENFYDSFEIGSNCALCKQVTVVLILSDRISLHYQFLLLNNYLASLLRNNSEITAHIVTNSTADILQKNMIFLSMHI
jgi:hypothetical protein